MNGISKLVQPADFINTKIQSFCKLGRLQEALQFLLNLKDSTHHLTPSLYTPILQLCINSRAENEGRLLHNHLINNGIPINLYLNTKLVIFFAKMGDIVTARNVFDKMPERSVVSWTAMISGYCQNGCLKEGLRVFREMHCLGIKPNPFTYGSVLKACTYMGCLERGGQVQGSIIKSRFLENLFVQSALVDFHSKCGKIEDARYLFEQMAQRDVVCWNSLIGGYTAQGLASESFKMFSLMLREGLLPDQYSIGSIFRASGLDGSLVMVLQTHAFVVHLGFHSHSVVNGSLIDAYAKCGNVRTARRVYDLMQDRDLISCTALITGYARDGRNSHEALDIFIELHQKNMGMDAVVLCSMLNICANIASLSLGSQIHAFALKSQHNFDVVMGNALVDMYAKSGEIEDAYRAFHEMQEKNVVSWTSLITGYAKHGLGDKAIALFEEMEGNGLKPNDVTFLSVLFACSHTGMTEKGSEFFSSMVNGHNINPRAEHYACMADLFARGGQFEQAYKLLANINLKPTASLWKAILGASSTHGTMSAGKEAARHLFDLDPDNSANYVVLASMYSAAGLWEDAWKIRNIVETRNLKKDPGCSLVQYNMKRSLPLEIC